MTNNNEMEIDLVQLFLLCVRKWKTIILTAVVLAVLLAGYKGASGISSLKSNSETVDEADAEVEKEQYEAAKAAYDEQIKLFDSVIFENSTYKENSVLMNLDPNNYFSVSAMYYISTDYRIMPGETYQDIDYTNDVIQSYILYLKSNECLTYIQNRLTDKISLRYLKELISISQSSHIVNIEVVGDSSRRVSEILEALNEAMMLHKAQVDEKVYAHEISMIDKTKADNVSESDSADPSGNGDAGYVNSKQLDFANQQNNLINQRAAVYDKKTKLTEPKEKAAAASMKGVLKSCIKFGILGGVAGVFMAAFFICMKAIFADAVNNASEVTRLFGVRVFGDYKSKKSSNKLGDMLYRMSYGDATADKTDFIKVLSANIDAYITAFKDNEIKEIAFVGRLKTEDMKDIVGLVNGSENSGVLKLAGDILTDAEAIRTINDKKYAIVAVDRNTSKNDLRKQLEKLQGLEKTVIGAVLYE
ncbi:hypothetical protein [Oribacterium sp. P6A1]|uniref:hypothetical protein n=1 Tax=Oribacterium sp. P6A1 TaxID=1410612 RepID=UPI00056C3643|nr:hypothetical protein [Oribacterium sp. P6A1]